MKNPKARRVFNASICSLLIVLILCYLFLFKQARGYNQQIVSPDKPALVVLGLDGATWDIIDPMMQKGDLPTIKELCKTGCRGVLNSLEPMQSPNLWTSIATGFQTEKHGISGYFSTRVDLKSPRIWDICVRNNLQPGLFAWLVSWPPIDPYAFNVPAWMAHSPDTNPFEYECIQELYLEQSRYGGSINPFSVLWDCAKRGGRLQGIHRMAKFYIKDTFGLSEEKRLVEKLMAEAQIRTDLYISLLKKYQPDISTFTFYGSDKLAHRFWHYMEPDMFPSLAVEDSPIYKTVIQDYYKEADKQFGRILEVLPSDCTVVLLSDHGFKADPAAPRQFFIHVPSLLEAIGQAEFLHYYMIQRRVVLEPILSDSSFLKTLQQDLEAVHFEGESEPVFDVEIEEGRRIVLRTNFSLSWNEASPILMNQAIVVGHRTYPTEEIFFSRTFSGTHDPKGILVMKGPAIHQGMEINESGILDIAPTLLYLLNLPISRELPGNILEEAITASFRSNHQPVYTDRYDPLPLIEKDDHPVPEAVMERLRSLNYVK